MEEFLKVRIGGDIVDVTKSINQLEAEFKGLENQLKNQTGKAFTETNRKLEDLRKTIDTVKNVGRTGFDQFGTAIAGVGRSSAGAVPALNSLSQVARDLPFGFIAIQNNLPIVIDQFTSLARTSGGVGGALKGVVGALFGPAGLAFAFGAVTAGVTALIQKYGSLGAAFDSLIGGTRQLTEAQKKVTENIAAELAEVALLVNLYPQLEGRRKDQDKVLKQLNSSAPTYFKTLTSEKVTVDQLTASYDKYVKSLLGKIFIESQQERLTQIAKDYAVELTKLNDIQVAGAQRREKDSKKTENEIKLIERLSKSQQNLRGDIAVGVTAAPVRRTFDEQFQFLVDSFKKDAEKILAGTQSIVSKLDFGSAFEDEKEKVKKVIEELPKLGGSLQTVELNPLIKFSDLSLESARKAFESLPKLAEKTINNQPITVKPKVNFSPQVLENFEALDQLKIKTSDVANQFNEFLAPAINTVFGALENGQSIPKALAQSFKAMVVQIGLTIAKAAILAAILNAIFPGGTVIGGSAVKGFGAIFGGLLGGNSVNPNVGSLSGGLQLAGGVSFRIQGTDLVAVMNNANASIGRVG
jgi:hypothetical protein